MRFDDLRRKFRDMFERHGSEEKTNRNLIAELRQSLALAGQRLVKAIEDGLIDPPEEHGSWLRFSHKAHSGHLFRSYTHSLAEVPCGAPVGHIFVDDPKPGEEILEDASADSDRMQDQDDSETKDPPKIHAGTIHDLVNWWHTVQHPYSRFGDAGDTSGDDEAFIHRHIFIESVAEWLHRQFPDRFSRIPDLEKWNAVALDRKRFSFVSDWIPKQYLDPPRWVDTRKYYKDIDNVGFALPLAKYSAEACTLFGEWLGCTTNGDRDRAVVDGGTTCLQPSESTSLDTSTASEPVPRADSSVDHYFRRSGEFWQICFRGGDEFSLRHLKGLYYIARLLESPYHPLLAWQLKHDLDQPLRASAMKSATAKDTEDVGKSERQPGTIRREDLAVTDHQTLEACQKRLDDIQKEYDEAVKDHDESRQMDLANEREEIRRYLGSSLNLDGKPRIAGFVPDNHRAAVKNAVTRAVERIHKHDRAFAKHLQESIGTGSSLQYRPSGDPPRWDITL